MTKPTPYQLEKLAGMYKRNQAELAEINALIAKGKPIDKHRVKELKRAARAAERLEKELGVSTADAIAAGKL